MRLLVERYAAVCVDDRRAAWSLIQSLDLRRDIVETLGPQKVAVARSCNGLCQSNAVIKRPVRSPSREIEIPAAALRIQAAGHRHRFQYRRFSGAVFADQKCDFGVERQLSEGANGAGMRSRSNSR